MHTVFAAHKYSLLKKHVHLRTGCSYNVRYELWRHWNYFSNAAFLHSSSCFHRFVSRTRRNLAAAARPERSEAEARGPHLQTKLDKTCAKGMKADRTSCKTYDDVTMTSGTNRYIFRLSKDVTSWYVNVPTSDSDKVWKGNLNTGAQIQMWWNAILITTTKWIKQPEHEFPMSDSVVILHIQTQ